MAVELVAQPLTREGGVDVITGQQGLNRLGAHGGGAAHPAGVLLGVLVDELAVEGLDVVEGPLRAQLDGARQPPLVVDLGMDAGDPVAEEGRMADVVGAQEDVDRHAATDVLPEVLDRIRWRHDIVGRLREPDHVGHHREDAARAGKGPRAQLVVGIDLRQLAMDGVRDLLGDALDPDGIGCDPGEERLEPRALDLSVGRHDANPIRRVSKRDSEPRPC
jgi:hypothetical protein